MAGIRPPDNAAPAAQSESTEGKQCTLFVLCSQYVLLLPTAIFFRHTTTDLVRASGAPAPLIGLPVLWRFHSNRCTIQMLPFHQHALAGSSHDWKTRSVSRGNLAGAPVARSREHEVVPGACR